MDQQNEFDKEIYDEKKCTGSFPRPSSPPPPPSYPRCLRKSYPGPVLVG